MNDELLSTWFSIQRLNTNWGCQRLHRKFQSIKFADSFGVNEEHSV